MVCQKINNQQKLLKKSIKKLGEAQDKLLLRFKMSANMRKQFLLSKFKIRLMSPSHFMEIAKFNIQLNLCQHKNNFNTLKPLLSKPVKIKKIKLKDSNIGLLQSEIKLSYALKTYHLKKAKLLLIFHNSTTLRLSILRKKAKTLLKSHKVNLNVSEHK